jgi:hypothetical protein
MNNPGCMVHQALSAFGCTIATLPVSTLSWCRRGLGEFSFAAYLGRSTEKCMDSIEEIEQVVMNQYKLHSVTSIQSPNPPENANVLKFGLNSTCDIMFDWSCFLVWKHRICVYKKAFP